MKKKTLAATALLPIYWIVYFLFELVTGRVHDTKQIAFNIVFIILFAVTGFILFKIGMKLESGISAKSVIANLLIFLIIDQGIKFIIHKWFFNKRFVIVKDILSFDPIINSQGSWLNARFGTNVSFTALIIFNIVGLFLIAELYRYALYKNYKCFWLDFTFIFMFSGAVCSLIDKACYGGSLDFIGIMPLFIADIKDIYICLALFFFVLFFYLTDSFKDDSESSLKDDIQTVKRFFVFIKKDITRKL